MLKELFESICDQALEARGAAIVQTPNPPHRFLVEDREGGLHWHEADPAPRQHTAGDLATLVAWAQRAAPGAAAVWYCRTGVACLLNDDTRRDTVTLPLALSPQVRKLQELEGSSLGLDVKTLARLLRVTFDGCLDNGELARALEGLRFEAGQVVEASSTRDRSSLGRSITEAVSGRSGLPPQVVLTVPVFAAGFPHLRRPVRCAIETDAAKAQVQLIPLPGAIEEAIRSAEAALGEDLASALGEEVPVYFGRP